MKFIIVSAVTIVYLLLAENPEIHEWRGKGRTGVYPDKDLLEGVALKMARLKFLRLRISEMASSHQSSPKTDFI